MITRVDLNEKTREEIQEALGQALEAYNVELGELNTVEELQEKEQELMKIHDEFQAELKERIYELPNTASFDGEEYKKSKICDNIVYFLNKQEVEWSFTLGLYQTVKFWKTVENTISYEAYDTTLRLLNQVKYKGVKEWEDILVINEFLSACHLEYAKDASYLMFLAQAHEAIMNRAKLLQPVEPSAHEVEA